MQIIAAEAVGWYGTIAIVGAYFGLSMGWFQQDTYRYHFINLTGAIALGIIAYAKETYQVVTLEVIWGTVACIGMFKVWRMRPEQKASEI